MRLLRIISGLVRGKRLRNGCLVQNHANGVAPGKKEILLLLNSLTKVMAITKTLIVAKNVTDQMG